MKRKGSPRANAEIAKIVEKNIDLDTALALFKGLSKVGGRGFRSRMERVLLAVQVPRAEGKKKPKSKREPENKKETDRKKEDGSDGS